MSTFLWISRPPTFLELLLTPSITLLKRWFHKKQIMFTICWKIKLNKQYSKYKGHDYIRWPMLISLTSMSEIPTFIQLDIWPVTTHATSRVAIINLSKYSTISFPGFKIPLITSIIPYTHMTHHSLVDVISLPHLLTSSKRSGFIGKMEMKVIRLHCFQVPSNNE